MMQKNPQLAKLIITLEKQAKQSKTAVWSRVAYELKRSARNSRSVNLERVAKTVRDGETALVLGKLLSVGQLTKPVKIVAHKWSETAAKKVAIAKGTLTTIEQELAANPKGSKLRIIG